MASFSFSLGCLKKQKDEKRNFLFIQRWKGENTHTFRLLNYGQLRLPVKHRGHRAVMHCGASTWTFVQKADLSTARNKQLLGYAQKKIRKNCFFFSWFIKSALAAVGSWGDLHAFFFFSALPSFNANLHSCPSAIHHLLCLTTRTFSSYETKNWLSKYWNAKQFLFFFLGFSTKHKRNCQRVSRHLQKGNKHAR